MSNKVYDVLKFVATIFLPAVGALYTGLAEVWGLPCAKEVAGTILAVTTFMGTVLDISSAQYQKKLKEENEAT